MPDKCPHNTPGCFGQAGDYFGFMCSKCERDGIRDHIARLTATIATLSLEAGTHLYRRMRGIEMNSRLLDDLERGLGVRDGLYEEIQTLREENDRLRAAFAPMRAHAAGHDYSPPLRLSIRRTRRMVEEVDGARAGEERGEG